jgi:hypothetical protein
VPIGDQGLANFKDCKKLQTVGLKNARITDLGLAHLKGCAGLSSIGLYGTGAGNGGLAYLGDSEGLKRLNLGQTEVSDLSPLKRMKLTLIYCHRTQVSDLSPLKGMPLEELYCDFKPERDAEIVRSIKTLTTINGKPAAEFWKDVEADQVKNASAPKPASAKPVDPFRTKSVWVNDAQKMRLTVLERKGETFRARFAIGDSLDREVSGTVKDDKVSWLATDVRAVKGGAGGDNQATITSDKDGDLLDFTWRVQSSGATGAFVLRLKTAK